jgi:hypothetical protein
VSRIARALFPLLAILCTSGLAAQVGPGGAAAWTEVLQDNSFLVNEAYNQDPDQVQHVLTGWRFPNPSLWVFTFDDQWPVGGEKHQMDLFIPYGSQGAPDPHGFGDVQIGYQYQARLQGEGSTFSMAPGVKLSLPTGSWTKGLGLGGAGVLVSLPISHRLSQHVEVHLNVGGSWFPNAKTLGGSGETLKGSLATLSEGASIVIHVNPTLNLSLEAVGGQAEALGDGGKKPWADTAFLSPGVAYAINFKNGAQLAFGASVPFGLNRQSPSSSLFLYVSLEHNFRKPKHPASSPAPK